MSRCLGLLLCVLTAGTSVPAHAQGRWTLAGTTVDPWGRQEVPHVQVTLFPDSVVTMSDADGDFLLPWNGERGWLTFVINTAGPDEQPWCKRFAIHPSGKEPPNRIHDVGKIRVIRRKRLAYATVPSPPYNRKRPEVLRIPPPREGEPDTCRFHLVFRVDLWGRVADLQLAEGNGSPPALRDSVLAWYRQFDWVVPPESSCENELPFSGDHQFSYVWADSAWVLLGRLEDDRERPPRQRESGSAQEESTPP